MSDRAAPGEPSLPKPDRILVEKVRNRANAVPWAAGGDPQATAWGIGRREGAPVHLHHASCNCTRLSGTRPTVGSSMTGSWHWDPGRAHGDRRVQHTGTAGDRPGVCRPHALVLDGSPARRQPLCRWASARRLVTSPAVYAGTREGGEGGVRRRHCSSLRAKERGDPPQRARLANISTDAIWSSWPW